MSARPVTFRAELKSAVSDFLADSDMTCNLTEEAIVVLAVALADYREEGLPLFPRILICDDLDEVLRVVQGSGKIEIGSGDRSPETVRLALKRCAPLASGGWAIWIEREAKKFRFGVFREPLVPTSIDLRATISDLEPRALHAMLLAQIAPGTVEIISPGNPGLQIVLSGQRGDKAVAIDEELRLSEWFVEEVTDDRLREACLSFATSATHHLLRRGHGALVAVVTDGGPIPAVLLDDAVQLAEPTDFAALIRRMIEEGTSDALAELLAYEHLLGGMLTSDGLTVLDTTCRVLAFNSFVAAETAQLSARALIGGARHRAYAALCELVDGGELRGAFIRSSNGVNAAYEGTSRG
ncbi:MAG: hypothetical protein QOI95_3086 [Acidimicrobiaceae bacterium]|jgi:hypothetical protein